GLWLTIDGGKSWTDIPWQGASGLPQTYDLYAPVGGSLGVVYAATDDGIWKIVDRGARAERFALAGHHVTSLTRGSTPDEIAGAVDESRIFRLNVGYPEQPIFTALDHVDVEGLPDTVPINRFALDLHVGRGFLPGAWSVMINDYGGIALMILSITGLLFWWLPRKWRNEKPKGQLKFRQRALRWLYRGHGPIIGILAIVPILYLSITGIMVAHIQGLIDLGKTVRLDREALPPLYGYRDLSGEISDVITLAEDRNHMMVASRFGILETRDGGANWKVDRSLPLGGDDDGSRYNLFRVDDHVFVGIGNAGQFVRRDNETAWTELAINGPKLAITGATRQGDDWLVKSSRAIYRGRIGGSFEDSAITYPPITGTTLFLFLADIHTGHVFRFEFKWINDIVAALAIVLALSGPVIWWKRKWA
ncbi:MAG: PepSY domain-containing protein, partial [Alphaproteobacteria bacterium]|nr:PepSY domain-containing protein [Alphaproteobacteria bacterium]